MADGQNQFVYGTAGQADWDTTLNANLSIIERGYHSLVQAGAAVNTGHVLWMNSGGFVFHYNPMSESIYPTHYAYTAAASGDSFTVMAWGSVTSLGINSTCVPGERMYVSALTPGVIVRSYNGVFRSVGFGLPNYGISFRPNGANVLPETLPSSVAIAAVTGSLHLFTIGVGRTGYNRELVMIGSSADLVELKFFSDAARTTRLYETRSGGVSVVGSYQDRAMWPWENTDAVNSASIYGTLKVLSPAAVGSDTISIQGKWDRYR